MSAKFILPVSIGAFIPVNRTPPSVNGGFIFLIGNVRPAVGGITPPNRALKPSIGIALINKERADINI